MESKNLTDPQEELLTIEELAEHAMAEEAAEEGEKTEQDDAVVDEAQDAEPDDEEKSAIQQLKDFVNEDEDRLFKFNFNIKALVGGDGLSRVIAKNWFFIIVVVVFTCCYVTTRYMMQGAMLENDALTDTLIDRRYKALTLSSELLEHTLSSQIENSLQDSTIHMPSEQAFSLKTE